MLHHIIPLNSKLCLVCFHSSYILKLPGSDKNTNIVSNQNL